VVNQEYTSQVADIYSWADVYIHRSRIGETFGNTIVEANASGLPVLCALEPAWDCAPRDILGQGNVLTTPKRLLQRPEVIWELLDAEVRPVYLDISPASFLKRILDIADGKRSLTRVPNIRTALGLFWSGNRELGATPVETLAGIGQEIVRSSHRRMLGQ
jgi:glycosyltransferase involved in cell wall biosynthesis